MTSINKSDLNWVKDYLTIHRDSDFFPRPFEFDIIIKQWNYVLQLLNKINIETYEWNGIRTLFLPKDEISFRIASQLHPIDSFLALGIIKKIGAIIEKQRRPIIEGTVFSYRFNPKDSSLYEIERSWNRFWEKSKEMSESSNYILKTDITDFYNQIYHHKLTNLLETMGVAKGYIRAIDNLIKVYTGGISRGIPVGPQPFHLLAECLLIPIDNALKLKKIKFTRFVDDYIFFCNDRNEAIGVLYDFVNILDEYKLTINRRKTEIIIADQFEKDLEKFLEDTPINGEEMEILKIINEKVGGSTAFLEKINISPSELEKFSEEKIEKIFSEYLLKPYPRYPRIRWLLRRLSQTRIPTSIEYIIKNIEKFKPVLIDAINYINFSAENYVGDWNIIGSKLLEALSIPLVKKIEYLQMVLLYLFSKIKDLDNIEDVLSIFDISGSELVKRKVILAAAEGCKSEWIQGFRIKYQNLDYWSKLAVLYSYRVLPLDERYYLLKRIFNREISLLEEIIIYEISPKIKKEEEKRLIDIQESHKKSKRNKHKKKKKKRKRT